MVGVPKEENESKAKKQILNIIFKECIMFLEKSTRTAIAEIYSNKTTGLQ